MNLIYHELHRNSAKDREGTKKYQKKRVYFLLFDSVMSIIINEPSVLGITTNMNLCRVPYVLHIHGSVIIKDLLDYQSVAHILFDRLWSGNIIFPRKFGCGLDPLLAPSVWNLSYPIWMTVVYLARSWF